MLFSLEHFSDVVHWFGPPSHSTFMNTVLETCRMEAFHGSLSLSESQRLLRNQKPGSFLVRFSSSCPGDFTVSVRHPHSFDHFRVTRDPATNALLFNGVQSPTWSQLFDRFGKEMELSKKLFLTGPFARLFLTSKQQKNMPEISGYILDPPLSQK